MTIRLFEIRDGKIRLTKDVEELYRKAGYGIYGHSAVKLCHWTKKAIRGEGFCYKQKFYGIDCHRCMQFTPVLIFCSANCIFCWRLTDYMLPANLSEDLLDDPKEIIDNLIEIRKKQLMGFKGSPKLDLKKFEESLVPNHFTFSLAGEPCLYPKLPEAVKYIRELPFVKSIFIVTNGFHPEMLKKLQEKDALPTQLYLSTNAPNEKLLKEIMVPFYDDAFDRWLKSAKLLSKLKTRTVMRLTMIRNYNMKEEYIEEYAEIIKEANPHFVEVKAYMSLGLSNKYLGAKYMPTHQEIKEFSQKLLKHLDNFEYMDEHEPSRVVVLRNKDRPIDPIIRGPIPNV